MGLEERGILRPGMHADLSPSTPRRCDVSTFEDPLHYSAGIPYVAVNGELVVDGGKITAARPRRAGPGYLPSRGGRLGMRWAGCCLGSVGGSLSELQGRTPDCDAGRRVACRRSREIAQVEAIPYARGYELPSSSGSFV
jgi:N-acyl-D-aspartate/D-glutamate deacylase